ncbi:hypothetical protein D3C80_194600 [compost metagenome]
MPTMSATSRTIRDMRWKTGLTGCARIAMTESWISRVSCCSSSRPMLIDDTPLLSFSMTLCESIAWLITSSPTRLIRRSTRSRSTRIVWPAEDAAAAALFWVAAAAAAAAAAALSFFSTAALTALTTFAEASSVAAVSVCGVGSAGSSSSAERSKGTGIIGSCSPSDTSAGLTSSSQSHSANSKTARTSSSDFGVVMEIFQPK